MDGIPFSIFKRKWRGAEAEKEGGRWQTQTVCTPGHWKLCRGFRRKGHFPRQKKGKKKKNGITALCLSLHRQVGKGFWKSSSLPLSRVHTQSPARPGVAGSVSPMPGTGHVRVKPRPPAPGCGVRGPRADSNPGRLKSSRLPAEELSLQLLTWGRGKPVSLISYGKS